MRIAYIAPYLGPTVLKRRPIYRNVSTSNAVKIELVSQLLRSKSHEVDVVSQGEVIETRFKYYRGFREPDLFHPEIPVFYGSVLPIPRFNGLWSSFSTCRIVKCRHRSAAYDVVIIFNMKRPQLAIGQYALRKLKLPVILEYEDDAFVDVMGKKVNGALAKYHRSNYKKTLESVSACMAVSPHLLAQVPSHVPKLLLRGVVGDDIIAAGQNSSTKKRNLILFSGTHIQSNGIAQLIEGWSIAKLSGWELHITGIGELTDQLRKAAENRHGIFFHGKVERSELVRLMASARIGINPHAVSKTPGNVFAFKIIEYLGAGAHVITTPMGGVERELERGITFMSDNDPMTIAKTLKQVIDQRAYERTAAHAAIARYGYKSVGESLDALLAQVLDANARGHRKESHSFIPNRLPTVET